MRTGDALSDHARKNQKAQLDLIPFGNLDPLAVSVVGANIQAVLGLFTDIQPVRSKPDFAFLPVRNQYDASKILKSLAAETGGAPLKLGLTQSDLSIPILTYVFGESQLGGKAAVISLHRLFDIDRQIVYQRAAKIAVHEVGHLLGLEHCWEADCLMRFSKQLQQLDRLPLRFCSSCEYEVLRRSKQKIP
jgi:archaemetzincin